MEALRREVKGQATIGSYLNLLPDSDAQTPAKKPIMLMGLQARAKLVCEQNKRWKEKKDKLMTSVDEAQKRKRSTTEQDVLPLAKRSKMDDERPSVSSDENSDEYTTCTNNFYSTRLKKMVHSSIHRMKNSKKLQKLIKLRTKKTKSDPADIRSNKKSSNQYSVLYSIENTTPKVEIKCADSSNYSPHLNSDKENKNSEPTEELEEKSENDKLIPRKLITNRCNKPLLVQLLTRNNNIHSFVSKETMIGETNCKPPNSLGVSYVNSAGLNTTSFNKSREEVRTFLMKKKVRVIRQKNYAIRDTEDIVKFDSLSQESLRKIVARKISERKRFLKRHTRANSPYLPSDLENFLPEKAGEYYKYAYPPRCHMYKTLLGPVISPLASSEVKYLKQKDNLAGPSYTVVKRSDSERMLLTILRDVGADQGLANATLKYNLDYKSYSGSTCEVTETSFIERRISLRDYTASARLHQLMVEMKNSTSTKQNKTFSGLNCVDEVKEKCDNSTSEEKIECVSDLKVNSSDVKIDTKASSCVGLDPETTTVESICNNDISKNMVNNSYDSCVTSNTPPVLTQQIKFNSYKTLLGFPADSHRKHNCMLPWFDSFIRWCNQFKLNI